LRFRSLIEYEDDSPGKAKLVRNTIAGATSPGQINYLLHPSGQVSFSISLMASGAEGIQRPGAP